MWAKNNYIWIFSFILAACGGTALSPLMVDGIMIEGSAPTYQYTADISNLKEVNKAINGAHHGGLMDQVPVNGDQTSVEAKQIADEIGLEYARWPGGGTLKFKHIARAGIKGYGYDLAEIEAYINGGGGTSKDLEDWTRTVEEQEKLDYRYIDRYVDFINSLSKKPKIIFGMNVTLGVLSEEIEALDYLIAHGLEVVAVEMGNEAYQQFDSFDAYYAKSEPFLQAVKAKYPSIVRTMVIAPHPERGSHKKWNDAFKVKLSENDLIQGGVPHFYPDMSQGFSDAYAAYTTPKKNFEIQFDTKDPIVGPITDLGAIDLSKIITDGAPEPGSRFNSFDGLKANLDSQFPGLPLYMTEWNYLPTEGASNTLMEAFYSFKAIRKLQENLNIKAATVHNFIAPAGHGMITPHGEYDTQSQSLHKRAKYYSFYLQALPGNGEYKEASLPLSMDGVTAYTYYKEGKLLIVGINETGSTYPISKDTLGVSGYVTDSCEIKAISGSQLYSGADANEYVTKNNFYKTSPPPSEMVGMEVVSEIPGMSLFKVECDLSKFVPPPPPPPPAPDRPWYCKYFPWMKACKK